jgi:hypothetical protein
MIERTLIYPPADRELYRKGKLYSRWLRKYRKRTLFLEIPATTKQFPIKCPPLKSQTYGFGELFAGVHYLELGYEVVRHHWGKRWNCPGYLKAVEILGKEAADFIAREHPQPPDLFVIDRKGRFSLVEVKLPTDRLNDNQIRFFRNIETYLNKNVSPRKRAPFLPKGEWIELLRLRPYVCPQTPADSISSLTLKHGL